MKFNKEKNKIIVTGGSGFVGSWTIKALRVLGYKILNYDLKEGYDIINLNQLRDVIKEGDKVLHLAAIAKFSEADDNPLLTFETNMVGTGNVAIVCKENRAERLVYSSTGSVYMPIEQEPPITEDFKARGNSVYAVSKYIGEELITATLNQSYIILRYAHLYGEGKVGHGAVGGFIDRMNRGLAPKLYGGSQSNDFTYIKDIVRANIFALETEDPEAMNQVYNIGTGQELSTEDVFNILKKHFNYDKEFERLPLRTVDPLRFVYDISKAKRLLNYNPRYSFEMGIRDWFKKNV